MFRIICGYNAGGCGLANFPMMLEQKWNHINSRFQLVLIKQNQGMALAEHVWTS